MDDLSTCNSNDDEGSCHATYMVKFSSSEPEISALWHAPLGTEALKRLCKLLP